MPRQVGTRLSDVEHAKIEDLVEAGLYINVSDFVRDAVRARLSELTGGTRTLPPEALEEAVLAALRSRGGVGWPDEIAEELNVSILDVLATLEALRARGQVGEVDPMETEA